MKKLVKYFLIICIMFFLTGCSGNYDLKINEDMSVEENILLTVSNDNDAYKKIVKLFDKNMVSKEKYNVVVKSSNVEINYKENYDNFDDYILNSKLYRHMFDKIYYNKTDDFIDIYTYENKNLNKNNLGGNNIDIDVLQINISSPFKVKFNNADMSNDNTYTWTINRNTTEKKIAINYTTTKDKLPIGKILLIMGLLIGIFVFIYIWYKRYKEKQTI